MRKGERRGTLSSVRDFWENESCGERYSVNSRFAGPDDYCSIDFERYLREPQIPEFAQFNQPFRGRGLEIGLGTGADFQRNSGRGGNWVGLDLTDRSLHHVRARLGRGSSVCQGDAQHLPFADASFDVVYSWGVLLCCPEIGSAIAEVKRVLKPGGRANVMLYHARSWVAFAAWLRWGWYRGLSPRGAVTHMESPGTQAFYRKDAERLLDGFSWKSVRSVHTSWDTRWLGPIGRLGGDAMGWFLLCSGIK